MTCCVDIRSLSWYLSWIWISLELHTPPLMLSKITRFIFRTPESGIISHWRKEITRKYRSECFVVKEIISGIFLRHKSRCLTGRWASLNLTGPVIKSHFWRIKETAYVVHVVCSKCEEVETNTPAMAKTFCGAISHPEDDLGVFLYTYDGKRIQSCQLSDSWKVSKFRQTWTTMDSCFCSTWYRDF